MLASASAPAAIVIDAGIAVTAGVDARLSTATEIAWARWQASAATIYAPQLWLYEVTTIIRKAVVAGNIDANEADEGLTTALALGVTLVPANAEICRAALHWAERLKQHAAYDGFYLALASRLQAEFWTTDRRVVNAARHAGVRWVHWIGELEATEG